MISYKHFNPSLASRFLPSFVLFLALSFFGGMLQAQIISWPQIPTKEVPGYVDFIAPNEKTPIAQLPILNLAPEGFLMSVGSERGFISASLSPQITGVLFVDRTLGITLFNQINIALLSVSAEREVYLKLRFARSFEIWQQVATTLKRDHPALKILSDHNIHIWWKTNVAFNSNFDYFHRTTNSEKYLINLNKTGEVPFEKANYLFDDDLFIKLHFLASEGKMQAINLDLERNDLKELVVQLKKSKTKLSVVDISNAWTSTYMGKEGTQKFIEQIGKAADTDTVLLTTRAVAKTWETGWRYEGYDFKYIRSYKDKTHTSFYADNLSRGRLQLTDSATFNDSNADKKNCERLFILSSTALKAN